MQASCISRDLSLFIFPCNLAWRKHATNVFLFAMCCFSVSCWPIVIRFFSIRRWKLYRGIISTLKCGCQLSWEPRYVGMYMGGCLERINILFQSSLRFPCRHKYTVNAQWRHSAFEAQYATLQVSMALSLNNITVVFCYI